MTNWQAIIVIGAISLGLWWQGAAWYATFKVLFGS